jgi:hypothetical protein
VTGEVHRCSIVFGCRGCSTVLAAAPRGFGMGFGPSRVHSVQSLYEVIT